MSAAEPGSGLVVPAVPPDGWADPWLPGVVHEQAVTPERRTARGAWYTPRSVVEGLVRLAVPDDGPLPEFVADPTCGGGAFLLATLDLLVGRGLDPEEALTRVGGQDIDPDAVAVTRLTLASWAAARGVGDRQDVGDVGAATVERVVEEAVAIGDALVQYPERWPTTAVIIGNPPFGTPLRTGFVADIVAHFRQGREHLLGPYADLAAVHLVAAVERSGPGSTVALVLPQSVLAGRDTAGLRSHCASAAPLRGLWAAREAVFDAGIRACAVVLAPGAPAAPSVTLATGPDVSVVPDVSASPEATSTAAPPDGDGQTPWAALAVTALGGPTLPPGMRRLSDKAPRLGELISATAGFRDEYYGLVAACREGEDNRGVDGGEAPNRLVTVGSIEPLATVWGVETIKFGRKPWVRPTVALADLDDKVRGWTERQLVPKVVLATQSRVLEPVVDRAGRLIPATPLLSIHAEPDSLDLVAAVLLAPPVVAWAWQQWFGSAMAVDALKLAARQVAQLPLPVDRAAWDQGAAIVAETPPEVSVADGWARACAVAEVMNRAYGADDAVFHWWLERSRRPTPQLGPVGV